MSKLKYRLLMVRDDDEKTPKYDQCLVGDFRNEEDLIRWATENKGGLNDRGDVELAVRHTDGFRQLKTKLRGLYRAMPFRKVTRYVQIPFNDFACEGKITVAFSEEIPKEVQDNWFGDIP